MRNPSAGHPNPAATPLLPVLVACRAQRHDGSKTDEASRDARGKKEQKFALHRNLAAHALPAIAGKLQVTPTRARKVPLARSKGIG